MNRSSFIRWETALIGVIILELIIFGAINPKFLDPTRLMYSTSDFIYVGIVALPLGMIMLTAGIDISFASTASLGAIVTGVVYVTQDNMVLGIIAGLAVGALAGLVNGILIITTGAQPMVITLGTQFLFAGLALGVSGLAGVSAFEGISSLPPWFNDIANGEWIGIPNLITIFAIYAILFWILMAKTTFGRQMRLIGTNPHASQYAGFSVNNLLLVGYIIMGITAAFVGILLTSYVGSARADIGASLLMPSLTLVVIGGVSMFGGEGSMVGVIIATFVMGLLQQGLRFVGMSENQVAVVTGTALIIVASLRWWSAVGNEALQNYRARRTSEQLQAHHPDASQDAPLAGTPAT